MRKFIRLFVVVVITLAISMAVVGCDKKSKKDPLAGVVSHNITVGEDGTLKVLQLTDVHFINSTKGKKESSPLKNLTLRDTWAEDAVTAVINEANPDLIVVTGDVVFNLLSASMITGNTNNYETFKKFANFIDSFNIPWAFTFGNHDEEGTLSETRGKVKAKEMLGNYLLSENIKNCLYAKGPEIKDGNGAGNYIINVLNKDGSINTSLVMFDSGSYLEGDQHAYEFVHDEQLAWYENSIKAISKVRGSTVPSIVFQHIPMVEYQTVIEEFMKQPNWESLVTTDIKDNGYTFTAENGEEITYYGGVYNEGEVCASFVGEYKGVTYNGGNEFAKIKELGSTKYVFCGHDHRNTYSFEYQGVRLSYGMSIDYSANGLVPVDHQEIYDETEQRGGTLITIKADSSVGIKSIAYTKNSYREALNK